MTIYRRSKRLAKKIVEYNLKQDGYTIMGHILSKNKLDSIIIASKDDRSYVILFKPQLEPNWENNGLSDDKRSQLIDIADTMNAFPYLANVVFSPDLSVKDLVYEAVGNRS